VLIAGESWVTHSIHHKGFDSFTTTDYNEGVGWLRAALQQHGWTVDFLPSHQAMRDFPATAAALGAYQCVILSDIGANTLLLHPDTWIHSKPTPNRLRLLRDYVGNGGGLLMFGGYYSFQGINGGARYHKTAVEETLPVDCLAYDDRVEIPEGFAAELVLPRHPILEGMGGTWPLLLGVNEVTLKSRPGVELLARVPDAQGGHPLLATGTFGRGRTLAWTSDIGPHWLPQPFADWPGYARLWRQCLSWLTESR
jgi:uncharacterized membrane protein